MGIMAEKMETTIDRLGFRGYSPPCVDRIWLRVDYTKIPYTPYSIN